jgi:non-heme chloroperoxidase
MNSFVRGFHSVFHFVTHRRFIGQRRWSVTVGLVLVARLVNVCIFVLVAGHIPACAAAELIAASRPVTATRSEESMRLVEKSVTLANGLVIRYVEQGDSDGTPVILLHGYTDSWRSFSSVMAGLPRSLHVFALSQRGHGDTTRPAAGYQAQDFALDVAAFMDALRIGPALIVGHSMGSSVAQRFAIDQPGRTLGLVLVASVTTWKGNADVLSLMDDVARFEDPIDPEFVRAFQESTIAQPVPASFVDTVVNESLQVPARVWQATLVDLLQTDFSRDLAKIAAPTLVVWGDRDTFARRREQDALVAAIPDARLLVYRGAGHALHWEEPKRFADDLEAFAQEVDVRSCESARLGH